MRHGFRSVVLAACMLLSASLAHAVVPSTMSYQGVLTDNLGNLVPDGAYNLTFKIYNVPVAGAPLWTENFPAVTVTKGGFSVILGSTVPLTPLPFDVQYYLGVTVGPNPEMSPRVTLASSPYALSLRLPYFGGNNSAGTVAFDMSNNAGGPAIRANNRLDVGSTGGDGDFRMYENGVANPTLHAVGNFCGHGGALDGFNEAGLYNFRLESDCTGEGGWFFLGGGNNSLLLWDGEPNVGQSGVLTLAGTSQVVFDTNALGDDAVQLPASSVGSAEILDESGIASNHGTNRIDITSTSSAALNDLVAVTITTPAPGYVVVEGSMQAGLFSGTTRNIAVQISETSGGAQDLNHYIYCGPASVSFGGYLPCAIQQTFFKPVAGPYTFYLQAYNVAGTGAYSWQPTITATFHPTSYGAVTTIVAASEAGQFQHATPVKSSGVASQPSGNGMVVDLRELETKVRAEEARLAESKRALREAQSREQLETHAALTPVKK